MPTRKPLHQGVQRFSSRGPGEDEQARVRHRAACIKFSSISRHKKTPASMTKSAEAFKSRTGQSRRESGRVSTGRRDRTIAVYRPVGHLIKNHVDLQSNQSLINTAHACNERLRSVLLHAVLVPFQMNERCDPSSGQSLLPLTPLARVAQTSSASNANSFQQDADYLFFLQLHQLISQLLL